MRPTCRVSQTARQAYHASCDHIHRKNLSAATKNRLSKTDGLASGKARVKQTPDGDHGKAAVSDLLLLVLLKLLLVLAEHSGVPAKVTAVALHVAVGDLALVQVGLKEANGNEDLCEGLAAHAVECINR